ncbi:MAG: hypothetical protein WBX22_26065 [Silvibacterium sp.]
MDELIPVFIAAVFGALIWSSTSGRMRVLLLTATMFAIGVTATILSGEFAVSWLYLLQDIAEAATGLACGVVILRWLTATSLSERRRLYGAKTID